MVKSTVFIASLTTHILPGNGRCDGGEYNSEVCGWDGGDCETFNKDYPHCNVTNPFWVGDSICDGDENMIEGYMNETCGYDGDDCAPKNYPDCNVFNPYADVDPIVRVSILGNGFCDSKLNIEECGYDDGDCLDFNIKYPECEFIVPGFIGNGMCNGGETYVKECGFDGGDCIDIVAKYPNCNLTSSWFTSFGDGICNTLAYNNEACGWEDGDCAKFNSKYPDCCAPLPSKIGDGYCDGDEYSTDECGRDGNDCD